VPATNERKCLQTIRQDVESVKMSLTVPIDTQADFAAAYEVKPAGSAVLNSMTQKGKKKGSDCDVP
jgi:imidazole glycerol phosphate synthase subunit HisF